MIAYNKIWLANIAIRERFQTDADNGLITDAEHKAIAAKYPVGFYSPNLFVRIGLGLLTCVIVLFVNALLSLMVFSGGSPSVGGWLMFLGVLSYVALELMLANKLHYQSGADDALIIIAAMQIVGGFGVLINERHLPDNMLLAGVTFIISMLLTLRFIDRLMSATAACSLLLFLFHLWMRVVPAGLTTAPFAMMAISGFLYWLSSRLINNQKLVFYHNCLHVVQIVSLVALYAAGNYYVVKNLSFELGGRQGPVPLGFIFWIWTFGLPVAYLVWGLRRKDATILRIGLLLLAAAGLTFRNYYHVLPVEIMLTLVGAVLLMVVFLISRYLKTPKHGVTAEEPTVKHALDKLKVEALISAGTFSHTPQAPTTHDRFGGGDFGGGGSSAKF